MRKLTMVIALSLGWITAHSQNIKDSEIPTLVKSSFTKGYPTAKEVKWEKENGSFEASFDLGKSEVSVILDSKGAVLEEETEIAKSELPKAIVNALKKDFAKYKIEEAAKIIARGVVTYEAEAEQGEESYDLIFDGSGKLLKKLKKEEGKK